MATTECSSDHNMSENRSADDKTLIQPSTTGATQKLDNETPGVAKMKKRRRKVFAGEKKHRTGSSQRKKVPARSQSPDPVDLDIPPALTSCIAHDCQEADSSSCNSSSSSSSSSSSCSCSGPSAGGDADESSPILPMLEMSDSDLFLTGSSYFKRGSNGWEESLRPRPTQVNHYQSILGARKRKAMGMQVPAKKNSLPEQKEEFAVAACLKTKSEKSVSHAKKSQSNTQGKRKKLAMISDSEVKQEPEAEQADESQDGSLENQKFDRGHVVWGKLGSTRWWPALVVSGEDCGQQVAREGHLWVFWFGDHKISELLEYKLVDFVAGFRNKFTDFGGKLFRKAVVEATRELWSRTGIRGAPGECSDDRSCLSWAKTGFPSRDFQADLPVTANPEKPIPEAIQRHLDRIKGQYLEALRYFDLQAPVQFRLSRAEQMENKESALKRVHQGKLQITDVCIACDSVSEEVVTQHPLFEGGLCAHCRDDIVETMFAYEEDGTSSFCVICAQGGEMLICDNPNCKRCYCTGCVEILVEPGAHTKVLSISPWMCYMCQEYDATRNGLIRCKGEWQGLVMELFQPPDVAGPALPMEQFKVKRPIRVLSLFDGIGTGRLVLDQMGLDVEAYFSSELDQDAIHVATVQHGGNVTQLGRIENLSDSQVTKLCPIDLVIGGSPCNDLSLVNPIRKGLYDPTGTGKLFFDFFRVLRAVQLGNRGRHVFWLYENVASMPQEYKSIISRFLQCQPALLDSKYFSAQNRARYFWGNIPGIYTQLQPHLLEQKINLDSILTPNLNRKATVEKIRTVTTRSNSLKQGKAMILPVTMNGESDVLWITELEQVFGFPRHYTDAGNIPLGRRQQLLGRAWSVPVIRHLFSSLRNFFSSVGSPTTVTSASPTSTTHTSTTNC